MAKKSLTKRIHDLADALGRAEKPSPLEIRNELFLLGPMAESLEDGHALAEKETAVAALKQENENLKIELQATNAELEKFREEQNERDKKERIDPVQFQILSLLPSPSGTNWLRSDEIARALKIQLDEADAYIDGLKKLGYIIFHPHDPGGGGWRRTESGNTLAVAKRWAGEKEEDDDIPYKYPTLSKIQHTALVMMAGGSEEGALMEHQGSYESEIAEKVGESLLLTQRNLRALRRAEMATDGDEPQQTYGTGTVWWLLDKGKNILRSAGFSNLHRWVGTNTP